ncbi:InlB B-repeat-containing protein, partial [Peptococcus simiae]|uniref:InlB B-repeat-containing protein n=1 Tax=Peptococcus simiae TaxID=1643805 RepID=UPI003980E935
MKVFQPTRSAWAKKAVAFLLIGFLLLGSLPLEALASSFRYHDIPSEKYNYINAMPVDKPATFATDPANVAEANAQIKDPDYPKTYTMAGDFKVQRGDRLETNYQPYIATVGDERLITPEEEAKVNHKEKLPELDGYTRPTPVLDVNYKFVKSKAIQKGKKVETNPKDPIFENSLATGYDFKYTSVQVPIKIKHVFQDLYNKEKYGPRPGDTKPIEKEQSGQVGHDMVVTPLDSNDRLGFEPEANVITVRVPENPRDFVVEYRYNRAKYNVSYDTAGGSDIPARVLYYGQTIPNVKEPTKVGAKFLGWKASHAFTYTDDQGGTVSVAANTPIANKKSEFKDAMPAHDLTFTAVWEDNPQADYTVLYYTEKPDHDFGSKTPANRREKYDFVGARVMPNAPTGSQPNLEDLLPIGVTFPDLEGQSAEVVKNKDELSKYYTYNAALTKTANAVRENKGDGTAAQVQKKVSSTGKTVYEVYYDRTVYTLIFEKINISSRFKSFDPEITVYDKKTGNITVYDYKNGSPDHGNEPYSITARFGESLANKWVRDGDMGDDYTKNIFKGEKMAYISKGYPIRRYSQGWCINKVKGFIYRDTPPYRLTKGEFIDVDRTLTSPSRKDTSGQPISYAGTNIISMGIAVSDANQFMPHHVDFQLEDIDGVYRFHPDLYYWKSDTDSKEYSFPAPSLKGFTKPGDKKSERVQSEEALKAKNNGRAENEKTPFAFQTTLNRSDFSKNNGYIPYQYKRNAYTLNLNSDPTTVKEDAAYTDKTFTDGSPQSQAVKYQKPLADLTLPVLAEADEPPFVQEARAKGLEYKFKGWALDPSGVNFVQKAVTNKDGSVTLVKDPKAQETMPDYNLTLYGIWGEEEPDWTIAFDPNGGTLTELEPDYVATHKEGEEVETTIGKKDYKMPEIVTEGGYDRNQPGKVQKVKIGHRLTIKEPSWKPKREGYDFLGWELVRKNANGTVDTSYYDTYKVPELYAFQNETVADAYLKAIWVSNELVPIKAVHHFYKEDGKTFIRKYEESLPAKRIGSYTSAVATQQGAKYLVLKHDDKANELEGNQTYEDIYKKSNRKNGYFQTMKVQDPYLENGTANPDAFNEFHFFYREFKTRKYKVNYFDDRVKGITNPTDDQLKTYRIINKAEPELVENGNRHFDARNYRHIPGWKLVSAPQQQLFFDLDEEGNFLGINGTGKDEIAFYYQDVRVIERDDPKAVTPEGYHRVIFKIDPDKQGGNFGYVKDEHGQDKLDQDGNKIPKTQVVYDVIDGLYSDNVPVPKVLEGADKEAAEKAGTPYINADPGKKFLYWDNAKLFNEKTVIGRNYEFTAYFNWAGLQIDPLVRTEALTDVNTFAPTIDELKAALSWVENGVKGPLPAGVEVTINETESEIYAKVKELGKSDSDEDLRDVTIAATVDYGNGSKQAIEIPLRVYKNRYEALTTGEKPKYLLDAEKVASQEEKDNGKKDGDLVDILKDAGGRYVKVTVNPSGKQGDKDAKVYYVNPKALVDIPEIALTDEEKAKLGFTHWTASNKEYNEGNKENGVFKFKDGDKAKRYRFTTDTVISPGFAQDVVPQEGAEKPNVPESYVKVIVKTTDKATDETAFERTFWVNATKEVAIEGITNPTGKVDQDLDLGGKTVKAEYLFKDWQKVQAGKSDDSLTEVKPAEAVNLEKHQFTDKVTVIEANYKKSISAVKIPEALKTSPLHTPEGKTLEKQDYIKQITPQEGKEIKDIEIIKGADPNTIGEQTATVIVKYKDGSTTGTQDSPVKITVTVHEKVIPSPNGEKPKGAMDNYVKVNFKAGTGGSLKGTLTYYVSPEVEVDLTQPAKDITKAPETGYLVQTGQTENWTNANGDTLALTGTFKNENTFIYNFVKNGDIIEKVSGKPENPPQGYVTVTFAAGENGNIEGGDKTYYVNPKAGIKLKILGDNETAGDKELAVPTPVANTNYSFDKWVEAINQTDTITGNLEHVAHFSKGKVTLSYKAGEGTGDLPKDQSVNIGDTVQLANQGSLTKDNAEFAGWKFDGDDNVYKAGERVTLTESKTATAQWTTVKHTVSFDSKGGTDVASQEVEHGGTLQAVTKPTKGDQVFMGWKEKGKTGDTDPYFDLTTAITENKALVAIWQAPVQKIGENDPVEAPFIKVTFNQGDHGSLQVEEARQAVFYYKVAKDLTFADAQAKGMAVPTIIPANYYKAKAENSGWDQALALNKANIDFTAQYAPEADVIPINPDITPDEKIDEDRPEGMVIVEFVVDEEKAFMTERSKFYVAKDKEVTFKAPVAYNKVKGLEFTGWENTPLDQDGKLTRTFAQDTKIPAQGMATPELEIQLPNAGEVDVRILNDLKGATGKLEVVTNGQSQVIDSKEVTVTMRRGRRKVTESYTLFAIGRPLQSGELIRYWAEKDGIRSDMREFTIK